MKSTQSRKPANAVSSRDVQQPSNARPVSTVRKVQDDGTETRTIATIADDTVQMLSGSLLTKFTCYNYYSEHSF